MGSVPTLLPLSLRSVDPHRLNRSSSFIEFRLDSSLNTAYNKAARWKYINVRYGVTKTLVYEHVLTLNRLEQISLALDYTIGTV